MGSVVARALGGTRRRLIIVFTVIPALLFGVPAAIGVPWLVGDNLIQNYPLRLLVGTDLGHGHLPLWDPLLWSGTPLLAGFNAGAAYPTTALFAVLPSLAAWATNQVVVEVLAATGVLALLRVLDRSWLAAGLAAAAFTYGGFMATQSVHIDLVQAGAWLPWAFVAVNRLAHRPAGRSAAPWVALLGASLGLMVLSGAAEPIIDGGVVLAVFTVWQIWRAPGGRWRSVMGGAVAGVGVGFLVSALQTLPGAQLQARSQRAAATYQYFSSGSMNKSLTVLSLDPTLLGGAHSYPTYYFATFNLPEVSSYVGIMAVMALVGLLARRHWRSADARNWRIWYLILAIGLVLTWGNFTPLGPLEFHLPLYDSQRLLSRNLLEVDLAASVLFGVWVDRMFGPAIAAARPGRADAGADVEPAPPPPRWRVPGPRAWRSDVVLPLIPVVLVVGLQVAMLAGGTWFPHLIHVPGPVNGGQMRSLALFLSIPSALAVAAGWLVVRRRALGRRLPALLTALLVADLALFNVVIQGFPSPNTAVDPSNAWANGLAAALARAGPGGAGGEHRLAVYDPERLYPLGGNALGAPDLNVIRSLASVQGYGALAEAEYDAATATHRQGNLSVTALTNGTFDRLDLAVLAAVPESFMTLVLSPPPRPGVRGTGTLPPVPPDPGAPLDVRAPAPGADRTPRPTMSVGVGRTRTRFFGAALSVRAVQIPVAKASPSGLRVGLLGSDGRVAAWLTPSTATGIADSAADLVAVTPHPVTAVGIVLRATATTIVGPPLIRTAGQGIYRLDGSLTRTVSGPAWRTDGHIGVFPLFITSQAAGRAWLAPDQASAAAALPVPGTAAAAGATGSVRVRSSEPWGTETIAVDATHPEVLVRSVAYAQGWQATVQSAGRSTGVAVRRAGLVQAVPVPSGASTVTFRYRPHRVVEGLVLSGVGVVAVAGLVAWPWRRRLRRRPPVRRRRPEPASTPDTRVPVSPGSGPGT
jgi:hypothetical protein